MATHGENAAMVVAPAGPGLAKATGGGFSRDQRDLILQTCCGGATESEARVLIAIAEARGLNPLLQECYFVKRYDKDKRREVWAVQAAIDSFRIKAEETGDYAGQDEPEYEYEPGGKHLKLARVRVYRKSVPGRPFAVGVAFWSEYVQLTKEGQPTKFWRQMPHNQLAKCAEALALRKAFPKVLAKVYVAEEMAQADNEVPPAPPTPKPETKPKAAAPSVDLDALAKDFERVIGEVVTSKGTLADLRSIGTLIAKSPLDESRRAHLQDVWLTARDFVTGRQPGED